MKNRIRYVFIPTKGGKAWRTSLLASGDSEHQLWKPCMTRSDALRGTLFRMCNAGLGDKGATLQIRQKR